MAPSAVIFDLGGVLIDWNPRHLYRKLIAEEPEMERFLAEVCTRDWHERQDAGGSAAAATEALVAAHPGHEAMIRAWYGRFGEMMHPMPDTVAILDELHGAGAPLFAITNWPADTFPPPIERFGFVDRFRDIVVSGQVKLMKPDPAIFTLALDRFGLQPAESVFIDDNPSNVAAARDLGIHGLHFRDAAALRRELAELGMLA